MAHVRLAHRVDRSTSTSRPLDGQVPPKLHKAVPVGVRIVERPAGIRATLWRNQAAAGDLRQALPKPVESLPEHMPRLTWASAHKNVRVIPDRTVLDAVWNRKVAGKFAGLEYSLEVGAQKTRVCSQNGNRRRMELCEPVAAVYRVSAVPD
jgi:hypothetical protein